MRTECTHEDFEYIFVDLYRSIPENPTSAHHLMIIEEFAAKLVFEKENYHKIKAESLAKLNECLTELDENSEATQKSLENASLSQIRTVLGEKKTQLEALLQQKFLLIKNIRSNFTTLTSLLQQHPTDDPLNGFLADVDVELLQNLPISKLSELSNLKVLRYEKIYDMEYFMLQQIWTELGIPNDQQQLFFGTLDKYSEEGISSIRQEIARLTPAFQDSLAISQLCQQRSEFIEKMKKFEISASDPARLFRSSFQLNQEERFRKTAYPTLIKLEKDLIAHLKAYGQKYCAGYKQTFLMDLEKELQERFISEIFFSFDESVAQRKLKTAAAPSEETAVFDENNKNTHTQSKRRSFPISSSSSTIQIANQQQQNVLAPRNSTTVGGSREKPAAQPKETLCALKK